MQPKDCNPKLTGKFSNVVCAVVRAVQEKGLKNAGIGPTAVRHFLSDSIYLWGCGERAANEEHDPTLSDRAIGWLILLVSRLGCRRLAVSIVLARGQRLF